MRIRTIKPDIFISEDIAALSYEARWMFIGLLLYVDDQGRGRNDPRLIKAAVYPIDDEVTTNVITERIGELVKRAMVCLYRDGETPLLHVVNFTRHQKINRPTPSKLPDCPRSIHGPPNGHDEFLNDEPSPNRTEPAPPNEDAQVTKFHGGLTEDSLNPHGGLTGGKEGKGRERNSVRSAKETLAGRQQTLDGMPDPPPPKVPTVKNIISDWIDQREKRPHHKTLGAVSEILREAIYDREIPENLVRRAMDEWITSGSGAHVLRSMIDGLLNKQSTETQRWRGDDCPEHRAYPLDDCPECGYEHNDRRYWVNRRT